MVIVKRVSIIFVIAVLVLSVCLFGRRAPAFKEGTEPRKIAIVIDDFGYDGNGTEDILKIKEHLTAAVMPNSPCTAEDAKRAHENGFEVIVHLPMEPVVGKKSWLPPDSITSDLDSQEILKRTCEAFDQVPYAVGFNNHMGSKITVSRDMMYVILDEAKRRNFYVIDSKTTQDSVIDEVSQALGIEHYDRDLFIDGKSEDAVYKQVLELAKISEKKGYAIGIGHVGPAGGSVTAKGILDAIPELKKMNIELVYVSQLKGSL